MFEPPALVTSLHDLAVMGEPVEERRRHFGVAKDTGPFGEGEVGGDDDGGALVKTAHQMEEQLAARLGKGQIAQLVQDHEVEAGQVVGQASLAAGAGFAVEPVDQIDDIVEAPSGAAADAGPGDRDGKMAFAGAWRDSVTMPGVRRSRCESSILFILGPENWCKSSTASGSPVRIIWSWFSWTARTL